VAGHLPRRWLLYYTPQHMKILLRRAAATGVPIGPISQRSRYGFDGRIAVEKTSLQAGIFRLKHRRSDGRGLFAREARLFYGRGLAGQTIVSM